ncbi:uncharacterized protein BCR38DRAFT_459771 [Pseudomassariella vexata]|uniref:Uncharacterized protein n=1 Tax=Pseudomassariella vexata TaxID=1141098 RepID=A0A1Y2DNN9_9PEZI|nr:uncharacterized protein BCR38DRAFT_459771 [Pseudomassariella vexata]ORY60789.1 hypothetical protein BCR38DRAFT_459771 [Pseudomassariella vexata]
MDRVKKNLSILERKLTKANKLAAKGDDMKLADAIKLGRKSNAMVATIQKGIKEYDGSDPTAQESMEVLEEMKVIVSLSEQQVELLMKDKPVFDKLHVGGLVKRNLGKTSVVSEELENIMLSKAPDDLKAEAEALAKRRKVAFEKAMAIYSNASGGEDAAEGEDDSD